MADQAARDATLTLCRSDAAGAAAAAMAAVVMTLWAFGGTDILAGRPVKFSGDAVFHYGIAKTVLDDPWTWHAARLGAPFGSTLAAFGESLPVESALMKLVSLSTDDAIALLNRTWLLLVGLSAAAGHAAFRMIGLPRTAAAVCGCLFATAPCGLLRHVAHFNLHCAFVPLPMAAAVLVAAGRIADVPKRGFVLLSLGCLLGGLAYVYYPFFLSLTMVAALAVAWGTGRRTALPRGVVCLFILAAAAAANLAPTLIARGRVAPAGLDYKHPAEADVFALRLRDLVLPSRHSLLPPLAAIGRRVEAIDWPLTNENRHAKLGLVGAAGLALGLAMLAGFRPPAPTGLTPVLEATAALMLFLLLLAVAGGLGSIFNAFVSPQIRCYNRVAPLLLFLALPAAGGCLAAVFRRLHPAAAAAAWAAVLAFGLIDHNVAAATRSLAASAAAERAVLEPFVRSLEESLPADAAICMLPFTPFPLDVGSGRMEPYDHAKPWLFSSRARWSWPIFGRRHAAVVAACGDAAAPGFAARLRQAGFTHVWLDLHGRPEEVGPLERAVSAAAGQPRTDTRGRYRVYDISSIPAG